MADGTRPIRLQLSRRRGFNLQEVSREANGLDAVNVARPTKWGNPFKVDSGRTAERAVDRYREYLRGEMFRDSENRLYPPELAGKNLACWCPLPAKGEPDICHAAVLLEIANREPSDR